MRIVSFSFLKLRGLRNACNGDRVAFVGVLGAILSIVRRKMDSLSISRKSANLGEFEGLKSDTENRVENGAG